MASCKNSFKIVLTCLHKTFQFETFMILSVFLNSIIAFIPSSDSTINLIKKTMAFEKIKKHSNSNCERWTSWKCQGEMACYHDNGAVSSRLECVESKGNETRPRQLFSITDNGNKLFISIPDSLQYLLLKIYVVLPSTVKILFMSFSHKQGWQANPE